MKKLLRPGKIETIYLEDCRECGALYVYEKEDIDYTDRPGYLFIVCPFCGVQSFHSDKNLVLKHEVNLRIWLRGLNEKQKKEFAKYLGLEISYKKRWDKRQLEDELVNATQLRDEIVKGRKLKGWDEQFFHFDGDKLTVIEVEDELHS